MYKKMNFIGSRLQVMGLLATYGAYIEIFLERINLFGSILHMVHLLATSGDYGRNILVVI